LIIFQFFRGEDETKPRGNSFYDSATQLVSNISSMLSSNLVGKPVDKNDDDYFMIDSNEKISQPTVIFFSFFSFFFFCLHL